MADVTDFTVWSSTAASNKPAGGDSIGTGLDDNLRQIQAEVAKWRDGTGYGVLTLTSVSGTNTIVGTTSPAPTLAQYQKFLLTPAATNTGATTLNVNSGGAKNVYAGNSALVGGELHASIPVLVEYDGTQYQLLGPVFRQPTRTVYTSGTGTHTTATGATRLNVRLIGGGGGGGAAKTNDGTAGGDTTFGSLTGSGGAAGATNAGSGGSGGAASGGDFNIPGGSGGYGSLNGSTNSQGGEGGNGFFGGGAGSSASNGAGRNASTNSGGGGSGGGDSGSNTSGAGGGAGGYVEKLITAPAGSYSYAVGAAGSGGSAGTNAGGNGAAGIIIVDTYFD